MSTLLPPLPAIAPPPWADVPPGPPPAGPPKPLLENTEFLIACGLMALVLFGGAFILSYFDRRRKRQEAAFTDTTAQLESYRELYESGEITGGEYQRLRERVAGRMKREVGLPGAPPRPADAPPPREGLGPG